MIQLPANILVIQTQLSVSKLKIILVTIYTEREKKGPQCQRYANEYSLVQYKYIQGNREQK